MNKIKAKTINVRLILVFYLLKHKFNLVSKMENWRIS